MCTCAKRKMSLAIALSTLFSKFLKSRQRKGCVIDTISENLSYSENFTEQKSAGNGAKAERPRYLTIINMRMDQ